MEAIRIGKNWIAIATLCVLIIISGTFLGKNILLRDENKMQIENFIKSNSVITKETGLINRIEIVGRTISDGANVSSSYKIYRVRVEGTASNIIVKLKIYKANDEAGGPNVIQIL